MQDRPAGVTTASLTAALAAGWGIGARTIRYLPVGAGGYHWEADGRWFLTVTDAPFAPLERALRTALELRLPFVVAPVPARDGSPLRPLPRPICAWPAARRWRPTCRGPAVRTPLRPAGCSATMPH